MFASVPWQWRLRCRRWCAVSAADPQVDNAPCLRLAFGKSHANAKRKQADPSPSSPRRQVVIIVIVIVSVLDPASAARPFIVVHIVSVPAPAMTWGPVVIILVIRYGNTRTTQRQNDQLNEK